MNGIIQQNVVYKTNKGTPVTDSVKVAQVFGKQHKNIMQSIRNILGSAENSAHHKWFCESTYYDAQNKPRPMFLMNRDGFSLLAMGLTGAKAMQFKVAFIEQFNAMEQVIQEVRQQAPRQSHRHLRKPCALQLHKRNESNNNKGKSKRKDPVFCSHKPLKRRNNPF